LYERFLDLQPARIQRMSIRIGGASKSAKLPEAAYGLSRYSLDEWLWNEALAAGAAHGQEDLNPDIVAVGRKSKTTRGARLFGFKAHFTGPVDDAVELYFSASTYVGVNCVERGITNVCGLAQEEDLAKVGFEVDALLQQIVALKDRLEPLRRSWKWIFTGPLEFEQRVGSDEAFYRAGDALSFVDPFTGSGLLCAIATGALAGEAAASSMPYPEYALRCSRLLRRPFRFSSMLRQVARTRIAPVLLRFAPADLLFHQTRPLL
jgi:hypothetical protein